MNVMIFLHNKQLSCIMTRGAESRFGIVSYQTEKKRKNKFSCSFSSKLIVATWLVLSNAANNCSSKTITNRCDSQMDRGNSFADRHIVI